MGVGMQGAAAIAAAAEKTAAALQRWEGRLMGVAELEESVQVAKVVVVRVGVVRAVEGWRLQRE